MASEDYKESEMSKIVKRLMDEEGFEFGEAVREAMEQTKNFESKADGGSIGIEVLFKEKMANGGRVPAVSGGFMKLLLEGAQKGKQGIMELVETGKSKFDDFVETQVSKKPSDSFTPQKITADLIDGPITLEKMANLDSKTLNIIKNTYDQGLYKSMPEILKAGNLLERFTKVVKGERIIDYERAEAILGVPLKGDETLNDLFKIEFETRPAEALADGGRVGLFMGGPALTGDALSVYNSMNAYGFSDQEIANALQERGLYTPGSTTEETGIIASAPNIINQGSGGGGEGPPPGPKFNRNDLLGTSDYQGTGPGFVESILGIPAALVNAYTKISPVLNFAKKVFRPNVETYYKGPTLDAIAKAEEERKAKAAAERAAFLAEQQRTNIASQLGGPDGTSGGKYAGGASFASANPYGGSGTMDDLGADNFKEGGLATRFKPRRR